MTEKLLWTIKQASEALSLSERTVNRMCDRDEFGTVRPGRAKRIPVSEVLNWIKKNLRPAKNNDETMTDVNDRGVRPCHSGEKIQRVGGSVSLMQAVKELDDLLKPKVTKRQKNSKRSGEARFTNNDNGVSNQNDTLIR